VPLGKRHLPHEDSQPMKHILCLGFAVALLSFLAPTSAPAQGTTDEVTYYDRAKKAVDTLKGSIQEDTPAGIKLKVAGKNDPVPVPVADIRNVAYLVPGGVQRVLYRKVAGADEEHEKATDPDKKKDAFNKAVAVFKTFEQEAREPVSVLRRDVQFRKARLYARQAEDDPEQADEAINLLSQFLADQGNSTGWQVIPVAQMLGALQEQKGDRAGALKTYGIIATNAAVPKEVRQDFGVRQAQALIRTKKFTEAEQQLRKMALGLASDDPAAQRIAVHLAECQVASGHFAEAEAKLKDVLKSNADGTVKALACNTLADGYREAKNNDEAFWYYLWVDTYYNQDKQERAKAVYYLSKLFEQARNDATKAQQFRDRLLKEKEFDGTDWQKHARSEK
jgi:hypothetical protein